MGGLVKPAVNPGLKGGPRPTPGPTKGGQPDLSISESKKLTGPKGDFGLTTLGESKPQTDEGIVTAVGSTPARKKKPTITLLGDQP